MYLFPFSSQQTSAEVNVGAWTIKATAPNIPNQDPWTSFYQHILNLFVSGGAIARCLKDSSVKPAGNCPYRISAACLVAEPRQGDVLLEYSSVCFSLKYFPHSAMRSKSSQLQVRPAGA